MNCENFVLFRICEIKIKKLAYSLQTYIKSYRPFRENPVTASVLFSCALSSYFLVYSSSYESVFDQKDHF